MKAMSTQKIQHHQQQQKENQMKAILKRHGKRTVVFVSGWAILIAGVGMLALPGPGLLVIIAGLSVLGIEFAWARRMRDVAQAKAKSAADKARGTFRRK
jgi:uncharacterized protein (TIGR02611 family)